MKEIFQNVLEASFHGGVIIALVLVLRLVLRNAPRRTICLLWLLAGLRLLLPFEIQSSLSLQPDPPQIVRPQTQLEAPQQDMVPGIPEDAVLPEDVEIVIGDGVASPQQPVEDPVHRVVDWGAAVAWVWLAGAGGFALYGVLAWLALRRRVREAVRTAGNVYRCHGLDTAFVLGCFRPRIYIPAGVAEIDCVLAHERTHIRRGDHWFKLLGFAALALHWFNPLVWAAYLLLCRDLEMACDEAVVRDMDLKERKAYSAALLACAAHRSGIAACPVAFGEVSVKQRIVRVLNYRRPRFWICVAAAAVVLAVAVCFLTSPGGLTKAEALESFYQEMDRIQSSDRLHLSFTMDLFESEMADIVELKKQDYWQDGSVWYRTFEYATAKGSFTTCYAEIDGVQYAREYSADIPDFNNRDWQELAEKNYANMPLLTTDWRSLEVQEVRRDRTDGGTYAVKLQGDLSDAGPTDIYYEKFWEAHLDGDGRLLCMHLYTHGEFYMYYGDTSGIYETKSITTTVVGEWDDGWRGELAELEPYQNLQIERLRRELAVERCRLAIEAFQSRDSYYVTCDRKFSGDILNDASYASYYRSGEDWLKHGQAIAGGETISEHYIMEADGGRYVRETWPSADDVWDTGWVAEPEEAALDLWLVSFYWDGADMELTALSDDENRVTFTIQGSPYPTDHGRSVEVAEYEATFCFVPGTNTLQRVTLDYVKAWPEFVGGQERTGTGSVSEVYSVEDMTDAQIAAVIDSHYRETQA